MEGPRGVCAYFPENTLLSFEHAIELGLDAVEIDVRLSSDGVPVLTHDGNAYRTAGVEIKEYTEETVDRTVAILKIYHMQITVGENLLLCITNGKYQKKMLVLY